MSERARLVGRLPLLRARARLNRFLRDFFEQRGFLEIEAPILVPSPGLEVHLDAFSVDNGGASQRYLITSPEYQMKRLVAGGLERAYSLGKVFRRGERGHHHNPEFTMLEWYAVGWSWDELATSVESLIAGAAEVLCGRAALTSGTRVIDLQLPWPRSSVRALFAEHAGVALDGDEDVRTLREKLSAHRLPADGTWSDLFFTVFLDVIEPKLQALDRPTLVHDWPRPLSALARARADDPRVVERFEAYIPSESGLLELCNGFGELVDPVEQRRRCEADLRTRAELGLAAYPLDEKFLAALGDMPDASGVALGVDRLAMLLLGAHDISGVLPFAVEEL
ncbi:MAG: EF-P lysine aminoacylase EpmA [Polyangia bacterium]